MSAGQHLFTPPADPSADWTIWITDGADLNRGAVYPARNLHITQLDATK